MSDLETFTDAIRKLEANKINMKRHEAVLNLESVLCLSANASIEKIEELGGKSVGEALYIIIKMEADKEIERATQRVLSKIATRLTEEIANET